MPSSEPAGVSLGLPHCDIRYYPEFLTPAEAQRFYVELRHSIAWRQDSIRIFGKYVKQPRLTALYGDSGKSYSYSGIRMDPNPFTQPLTHLRHKVEKFVQARFSSCLLNLYRDGNDSNGWHADDEKELGSQPLIASLSLGATRSFQLKHRKMKGLRHRMPLQAGSLLVMKGATQENWLHQVPKTRKPVGERINLTFRQIGQAETLTK